MKTIVLDVHGMSCHHCVRTVRQTLLEVEGVSSVDVTLHPGRATVLCADTVVGQDLVKALEEQTDYTAEVAPDKNHD
jgi:copper chaperone